MKKIVILFCIVLSLTASVSAQEKRGFKTIGDIKETSSKLGVKMIIDTDLRFENGGSSIKIIYKNFGDSPAPGTIPLDGKITDSVMTEEIHHDIDAKSVPAPQNSEPSMVGRLGVGVLSGSQLIAGVNLIEAKSDLILITRWTKGEKVTYIAKKDGLIREITNKFGEISKEQILP